MSRATLTDAKAELVALLQPGGNPPTGVNEVFDHLPPVPSGLRGPVSLCIYTDGIAPTAWRIAASVFMTSDVDFQQAQADLDTLLPRLDALMTAGFGPSNWAITFPTLDVPFFLATCTFEVGRQDYF